MKKRVLSLLIALLCLLFAQAQAANTCSHPVDQREPTMVQYSRTVGGVRQLCMATSAACARRWWITAPAPPDPAQGPPVRSPSAASSAAVS